MHFLYVKVPVANRAFDQMHEFEDKLDRLLQEAAAGSLAGWGDSLGAALPDGSRPVAYTRVDVDISNVAAARALLQANLPAFGAPTGTEIHYTIDYRHYKDIYFEPDWLVGQLA